MKKIFNTTYKIVDTDKIQLESINIETGVKVKEIVVISNPDLLNMTHEIVGFILEEYEYGLYNENTHLKEIAGFAINQAKAHLGIRQ